MSGISAIVPTYNRSDYLAEAVGAIAAQSRPVDEILIWDDGSTDGTEAVGRRLAADSSGRIRYRRSENRGKAHALNAALAEVSGDLIWICDDDDLALPDAAERLEAALTLPQTGLAAGAHDRFRDLPGGAGRQFMGAGYWPDLSHGSILRHLLEDIFFFQNATLIRRSALDRVGPFREDLARSIDYEMFVRLAARYPVAMVDGVMFLQRKHDGARGPAASPPRPPRSPRPSGPKPTGRSSGSIARSCRCRFMKRCSTRPIPRSGGGRPCFSADASMRGATTGRPRWPTCPRRQRSPAR